MRFWRQIEPQQWSQENFYYLLHYRNAFSEGLNNADRLESDTSNLAIIFDPQNIGGFPALE